MTGIISALTLFVNPEIKNYLNLKTAKGFPTGFDRDTSMAESPQGLE